MSPTEQNTTYGRIQDLTITSESVVCHKIDGSRLQERGLASNLHRSLSARFPLPYSPAHSESASSKASSQKALYNPVRMIFDPFVKSKSQRSALSSASNASRKRVSRDSGGNCNNTISKSLLNDLSDKPRNVEHDPHFRKKENHNIFPRYSPAHLHGLLRFEHKQGKPFFEFKVKSPDEIYVAQTWKFENSVSQVYTFRSLHQRKSNATGWVYKDYSRESPVIGQMHVSCYPCQVVKVGGDFSNSMVTEFVLYNVSLSEESVTSQNKNVVSDGILSWGNCQLNEASSTNKNKGQAKKSHENHHFDSLDSRCPAVGGLHPGLEIASIVMQIPFETRESVKLKNGDVDINNRLPNLLDHCRIGRENKGDFEHSSRGIMHVAIPGGSHSLPSSKSRGPSSILDRWRLGGGCDCGGWDMACPLDVFGSANIHIVDGRPFMTEDRVLIQLFPEGRKDSVPRFTMRSMKDGKYAIDFHAQLTSLQAFSICIAMLHSSETTTTRNKKSNQMLRADSMRTFPKEETEILPDAVQDENRFRVNKKNMEEILPSLVLDPPFSPIARA